MKKALMLYYSSIIRRRINPKIFSMKTTQMQPSRGRPSPPLYILRHERDNFFKSAAQFHRGPLDVPLFVTGDLSDRCVVSQPQ